MAWADAQQITGYIDGIQETLDGKQVKARTPMLAPLPELSAGNGEYAVALRSGLLKGDHAFIYAGCGIVAHSDPDSEFKETQMKFRPMQRALGGNLI